MSKKISLIMILLLLSIPAGAMAAGQYRWGQGGGGPVTGGSGTLSEDERAWLLFMREEEKLARDTYTFLYAKWGTQIFSNIATSEQRHMDAVKNKLDAYGIPDPVLAEKGKFRNTTLQNLYNSLILQGSISRTEALRVGVAIEERDITDLDSAMAVTTHGDIDTVYGNLLAGSYNHLGAFRNALGIS